MNELSTRERSLVSLGAAIAANCIPCVEFHVPQAKKAGLSDPEIAEAVEIADTVRRVPANMVMHTALARIHDSPAGPEVTPDRRCCCARPGESDRG